MNITTVGLDLAKNVFYVVGLDAQGHERIKKRLTRGQVMKFFANLPACVVGMEACASSHYFGRELRQLGHEVKLIPAQYVKGYVRGQKNDCNDARAIAEAARVPGMRCVTVKSVAQQDIQTLVRVREGLLAERTALVNRLRGLLGEYGIVKGKGVNTLRRELPAVVADGDNGLSAQCRRLLDVGYRQIVALDAGLDELNEELAAVSRQDDGVRRLQTIPGFGPVVASVFVATLGDGAQYRRGRDAAAAVGLVPRQQSTGGKPVLLGISKRGDRYLRSLLVHGARAVVRTAHRKEDPLSRWVERLRVTRGTNKATVALANKLARIGWAVLRHGTVYQGRAATSMAV